MTFQEKSSFLLGFLMISFIGMILSISSESWFTLWLGMEISSLFIMPILASLPPMGYFSWVVSWKYFVIQFSGSILFLLSLVFLNSSTFLPIGSLLLLVGVSIKVGLFPLHGWMFHVLESSGNLVFFLLSSIQKVAPLVGIYRIEGLSMLFISLLLITSIWSSVMSISIKSVKFLLTLSSMLFTSWMGFANLSSWGELVWLFLIYSFHLGIFLSYMEEKQFSGEVSSLYTPSGVKSEWWTISKVCSLGALMGLPPFGVFLIKLEVVSTLLDSGYLFPFVLIVCSGVMLFGYLKILTPSLLQKKKVSYKGGDLWLLLPLIVVIPFFSIF